MPRPGLRTKTGCLTCRKRRKKCDEAEPICEACGQAGRICQWPSPAQLFDRRFAVYTRPQSPCPRLVPIETNLLVAPTVSRGLEMVVTRHFMDDYYWLIILPNCHPDFMHGWITDMQRLMLKLPSLRYSILALAAAHMQVSDVSPQMEQLALSYYAEAVRELSALLSRDQDAPSADDNYGILISILLLYIQGCECASTSTDIPKHVNALARTLSMKFFPTRTIHGAGTDSGSSDLAVPCVAIERPFDRLAMESVLFQIFLAGTALWSDRSDRDRDKVHSELGNDNFWTQAESFLTTSAPLYPDMPESVNSPVLGIPIPCFRLALTLKQYLKGDTLVDGQRLSEIRSEIDHLTSVVLAPTTQTNLSCLDEEQEETRNLQDEGEDAMMLCYKDTSHLYILILNLLLDQLSNQWHGTDPAPMLMSQSHHTLTTLKAVSASNSHIRQAMQILQHHQNDDRWSAFFVGHWAVYTIGLFLHGSEIKNFSNGHDGDLVDRDNKDYIEIVRRDMRARWDRAGSYMVLRFRHDMEETWAARRLL